jgi:hypothetical protein
VTGSGLEGLEGLEAACAAKVPGVTVVNVSRPNVVASSLKFMDTLEIGPIDELRL